MGKYLEIYEKYHKKKQYELLNLFERIHQIYAVKKVLYPGSFVHITPAFVFDEVVFNDVYAKLNAFYQSPEIKNYIKSRRTSQTLVDYKYVQGNYAKPLPLQENYFDLLISQYAGFVSEACSKYLRVGGILVANDSHGDATLANLLPNFKLVAVMNRKGEKFSHSTKNLDLYFIPKKEQQITLAKIKKLGKGIPYTKYVSNYVFRKIQ